MSPKFNLFFSLILFSFLSSSHSNLQKQLLKNVITQLTISIVVQSIFRSHFTFFPPQLSLVKFTKNISIIKKKNVTCIQSTFFSLVLFSFLFSSHSSNLQKLFQLLKKHHLYYNFYQHSIYISVSSYFYLVSFPSQFPLVKFAENISTKIYKTYLHQRVLHVQLFPTLQNLQNFRNIQKKKKKRKKTIAKRRKQRTNSI